MHFQSNVYKTSTRCACVRLQCWRHTGVTLVLWTVSMSELSSALIGSECLWVLGPSQPLCRGPWGGVGRGGFYFVSYFLLVFLVFVCNLSWLVRDLFFFFCGFSGEFFHRPYWIPTMVCRKLHDLMWSTVSNVPGRQNPWRSAPGVANSFIWAQEASARGQVWELTSGWEGRLRASVPPWKQTNKQTILRMGIN